jgi:hypothetical protein
MQRRLKKFLRHLITIIFVLMVAGCNHEDRISRLEKETQRLREEIGKQQATVDYDLQAKCGKDSSTWFNENWHADKSTLLLTYSNHYNKKSNKCFVIVEYHTRYSKDWWANLETLWDLYENAKDGCAPQKIHTPRIYSHKFA